MAQSKPNCCFQSYAVQVRRPRCTTTYVVCFNDIFFNFLYKVGEPGLRCRWYGLVIAGVACTVREATDICGPLLSPSSNTATCFWVQCKCSGVTSSVATQWLYTAKYSPGIHLFSPKVPPFYVCDHFNMRVNISNE